MHYLGVKLPQWLVKTSLEAGYGRLRKGRSPMLQCFMMEQFERRVLMTAVTLSGTSAPDHIRFFEDENHLAYEMDTYQSGQEQLLPNSDTSIIFSGLEGNDVVTLDMSDGPFAQPIQLVGGTGTNTLLVQNSATGTAGNDSLFFKPTDTFSSPTNSFVIDGTPVTYDAHVQQPQFQLNTGFSAAHYNFPARLAA